MGRLPTTLPVGINPLSYAWQRIVLITPDGATEMAVHCLRCPESGAMTLLGFPGYTKSNSRQRRRQVVVVAEIARACGDVIEELTADDIGIGTGVRLAAAFHRDHSVEVVLLPVTRPF
jgi:hypothetical protein